MACSAARVSAIKRSACRGQSCGAYMATGGRGGLDDSAKPGDEQGSLCFLTQQGALSRCQHNLRPTQRQLTRSNSRGLVQSQQQACHYNLGTATCSGCYHHVGVMHFSCAGGSAAASKSASNTLQCAAWNGVCQQGCSLPLQTGLMDPQLGTKTGNAAGQSRWFRGKWFWDG